MSTTDPDIEVLETELRPPARHRVSADRVAAEEINDDVEAVVNPAVRASQQSDVPGPGFAFSRLSLSSSACLGSALGPRFLAKAPSVPNSRARLQLVRCELYSPCLRKSSAVSPGPAWSARSRISILNFAGWWRRRGFSSVSGLGALVGIVMASIPLLGGPGGEAQPEL